MKFRIPDLMQIASRVMEQVNSHNPDAVFVDGTGIGWGVHDRLNQLGCPGDVVHARKLDIFGSWELPSYISVSSRIYETITDPVKDERRDPDRWKDRTDVEARCSGEMPLQARDAISNFASPMPRGAA